MGLWTMKVALTDSAFLLSVFFYILSMALSPGGNDHPTLPLILLLFPAALLVPSIVDNNKCDYLPAIIKKVILMVFLIIL